MNRLFHLFVFLLAAVGAFAQTAQVYGIVSDPQKAVVPGARVRVVNQATGIEQTSTTNTDGSYVVPFLLPGTYRITMQATGFSTATSDPVTLTVGQNLVFNVQLSVGNTSEIVTVRGGSELLNTTNGAVSTVIDRQFIENMPLNGRSLQSLMTLAPGAVTGVADGNGEELSVNGLRQEANYFTVDGVAATSNVNPVNNINTNPNNLDGTAASTTLLGTTQSLISIDALQEFRVNTSTYSAEYGRLAGGQFSFTSRSGTNDWHGSAFEYFRNNDLDANNWFNDAHNLGKEPERQNDFGGTFGGPVRIPHVYNGRDRTFFSFSYEGLRLTLPQAATTYFVPSLSLRAEAPAALQLFLNAFPKPNGADTGTGMAYFTAAYSNPNQVDSTSVRIDHSINDDLKIFGRYSHSPNSTISNDPGWSTVERLYNGSDTGTLGVTAIIDPTLVNEFRFNFSRITDANETSYQNYNYGSITPDYTGLPAYPVGLLICFCFKGEEAENNLSLPAVNAQNQINAVDTVSKFVGKHGLKFGFDYRRLANDIYSVYTRGEYAQFYSEAAVLSDTTNFFNIGNFPFALQPVYMNLSFFLQDDWKITPRLSLSLGLRWDLNPAPKDAGGHNPYTLTEVSNLATATLAPANTPLWHTDYRGFGPRFGLGYLLNTTPGHETVLRTGFGVFYDTGSIRSRTWFSGAGSSQYDSFIGNPLPATAAQIDSVGVPSVSVPIAGDIYAADPNLRLPYTLQWSFALEQALDRRDKVTLTYNGNAARRLLVESYLEPNSPVCPASTCDVYVMQNAASSNYNAMLLQYQRVLSRGLQVIASYTWSHALDDYSTNNIPVADTRALNLQWADSNFDIRNNFQAAVTYNLPGTYRNGLASAALARWSLDTRITAQSAMPVDITDGAAYTPTGESILYNPNLVPGVPLYLYGPQYPGGRAINYNAFTPALDAAGNLIQGDVGRNAFRGFGGTQLDLAIRKDFHLGEKVGLQFRAEAFNLFNHPQFGAIYTNLGTGEPLFGTASSTRNSYLGGLNTLYQTGGPRSLQIALRLHF
jgi:Carboxypeptidase regulatory-like domain/TonB dependent receptor